MIPYGHQSISDADIDAVVQVLRSKFLTQGPKVEEFERAASEHVGALHGVAVNSATSALHMACLALGLGPSDWLWTSPNSFVASANCALYCGASVDFVDVDPLTYNLCPKALASKLEKAKARGCLPKVVVPVHFAGQSCDMAAIGSLAKHYGFSVVEDASHAIGARWQGLQVGACRHSDITVFSFHPVKIITTAEGGLLTTNSAQIAERLVALRAHGVIKETSRLERQDEGAWYYEQQSLGFNYRMTDMQAALGVSQVTRLDQFVKRRHYLAARYEEGLKGLPLTLPWQHPDGYSAFHLYVVQLADGACLQRRELFDAMRQAGVLVHVHYIPIHLQPYYQRLGFTQGDFPNAETYYERAISLPLYAGLSDTDQNFVITEVRRLLQ